MMPYCFSTAVPKVVPWVRILGLVPNDDVLVETTIFWKFDVGAEYLPYFPRLGESPVGPRVVVVDVVVGDDDDVVLHRWHRMVV